MQQNFCILLGTSLLVIIFASPEQKIYIEKALNTNEIEIFIIDAVMICFSFHI